MPLFANVKQNRTYNFVIEDPDSDFPRIFIENQAFNVKDLTPRIGEFFRWAGTNDQVSSHNAASAQWYDWPIVMTNGKHGGSWADSRQAWPGGLGRWDPWLLVLDYDHPIPLSKFFLEYDRATNKRSFVAAFYPRDISTNNMRCDLWVGDNLTAIPYYKSDTTNYWPVPLYRRQDGLWLSLDLNQDYNYVLALKNVTSAINAYTLRTSAVHQFFIGEDGNGGANFLEVHPNSHEYSVYNYGSIDEDQNPGISASAHPDLQAVTGGYTGIIYQLPSNFKKTTSQRKVFYSSHFNASGILTPKRIIWNKTHNKFSYNNCTVTYPGANTYSSYSAPPANSNYSTGLSNTWWIKGHAFKHNGVDYITFCTSEKCVHNYTAERWTTTQRRTWMTYSIGSGYDDDQLTFHSALTWPLIGDFPRSWVPANHDGNQMFVFQTAKYSYLTFDATTGWNVTSSEPLDIRAYGQDSTGRMWGVTRGLATATQTGGTADAASNVGYNSVYTLDPTLGYNITIQMANATYSYTGNTINTSCNVSIKDSSNNYVENNMKLIIVGNSMVFSSSNSNTLDILTSNTGDVTANIDIISGGVSYITASRA